MTDPLRGSIAPGGRESSSRGSRGLLDRDLIARLRDAPREALCHRCLHRNVPEAPGGPQNASMCVYFTMNPRPGVGASGVENRCSFQTT